MDTVQIELTNACINQCSNCTRFCGHHKVPFFLSYEEFTRALHSMSGYPKMVGFMGGEPLLHPEFEAFCSLASSVIPKDQLGLWTCLPSGKEHYAELICETFGHIFINDHSRGDIYHAPVLVGVSEILTDPNEMFYAIDHCWLQNSWSASINPNGAFFCEIAASMSILFDEGGGWPVESGWWWRTPKDFAKQIEQFCPHCGCCIPLPRRCSTDEVDDISPWNLKRLSGRSRKISKGKHVVSDLKLVKNPETMGSYKDLLYRARIAARYQITLEPNQKGFLTPNYQGQPISSNSLLGRMMEKYHAAQKRNKC
jgi:hypothetical protein